MSLTKGASHIRRAYAPGPHGQIHYRRSGPEGTRSPLLLLHSSPGTSYLYDAFLAEMGHDRTVIAPDFPGFGMSDAPTEAPGIEGYARAMLELETALGLGVFDVMGYHAGGVVAVEMARQEPKAVRKIVMISAPVFTDQERADLNKRFSVRPPDERAKAMEKSWPIFKTDFWRMGPDEIRTWNIYLDNQKNPEISSWGLRAAINYDLAATLPEIPQPILVLNPKDDLSAYTPRAAPLLKNGRIHDLPEWTHGMLDAKTAEIAVLVRDFLDK
jgi:pimeloyl-ACP methyl ester carboxylesterase